MFYFLFYLCFTASFIAIVTQRICDCAVCVESCVFRCFLSETCLCCAVEVKVELSLLEKEKEVDGLSPNGKASPFADCRPNGALGHSSDDDPIPLPLYHKSRDYVEASVCHVKDLENGQ